MRLIGFLFPLLLAAAPAAVEVEGLQAGMPVGAVEKKTHVKAEHGKLVFSPNEKTQVEVDFDKRGLAQRIYVTYQRGMTPLKDFTDRYGDPVRRQKGSNVKYVFHAPGVSSLTLEKETGYPGYYVEVVR